MKWTKNLMSFILAIAFLTLLTCCKTPPPQIDTLPFPELVFPAFPALENAERAENGVIVSESWIVALAEYKIKIAETQKNYEAWRAIYEVKE